MSQAVRACEMRRTRYLGQARTHLQHVLTAVAINLIRLVDWFRDPQLSRPVYSFGSFGYLVMKENRASR